MPADDLSQRVPGVGHDEREGAPPTPPPEDIGLAAEEREREIAWRRGEERERDRLAGADVARGSHTGIAPASVAARAFAALAENVRDYAIVLLDPAGIITFWGEGARLIKWWTKDQAEGGHLRLLYPAGGSEDGTAEAHLRQAAERGEYTGEGHRVRNDCSVFWAGVTLTALWDEDGTLLGFAKVTRDLTARRAADALLRSAAETADAARATAEAADAAKSGFLATMSHEIRTPINAILGYVDLLSQEIEGTLTAQQQRFVARAGDASRHLLSLIDEVLDFSRLEVAQTSVARDAVRIGDVVRYALALVAPQARAKGIDLADAVGGYAAGLAAWADESRVSQILVNLLGNAVKFTGPRAGEAARVVISAGAAARPSPDAKIFGEGPWVYVRVEDTGPGIRSDRLAAIFEPFVQADMSLARVHGGAGLGLAISRRLARLMGGDITARSEVGVGSTFFLWLPAAPVQSLQTGRLPDGEEPRSATAPQQASTGLVPNDSLSRAPSVHQETADAILAEIERILHSYVARLRSDPATPSAHAIDDSLIEDHLASFLADLAGTISSLDVAGTEKEAGLRDGTAIQRAIAERHGAQRARLGWSEAELRREFMILREEVDAAVRRRSRKLTSLAGSSDGESDAKRRGQELLDHFLIRAERLSVEGHRRGLDGGRIPAPAPAR